MKNVLVFCVFITVFVGCSSHKEDIFTVSKDQVDLFENVPRANLPEVKYGYSVYLKLLADADIVTEEHIVESVVSIGKGLAKHARRRGFPYVFTVINDERIFASSTPGGFIYITNGMLEYLKSEEEIAAILAHEIAQTQRRRMGFTRKKHFANLVQDVSGYAPFVLGPVGVTVPKGIKLVNNLLLKEASRIDRVIEADELACFYLQKEKYSTQALYNIVKRIATADASLHSKIVDYQRLRPITDERIKLLKNIITNDNTQN